MVIAASLVILAKHSKVAIGFAVLGSLLRLHGHAAQRDGIIRYVGGNIEARHWLDLRIK